MDDATPARRLIVCADDFGMGPETSRGIIDLALRKRLSATVLLVNSPYASDAMAAWRDARPECVLGWHPNLTLDAPLLPPSQVRSLVDDAGRFLPLGPFVKRWLRGGLRAGEIAAELRAQLSRHRELTGKDPAIVNAHQHVAVFHPVGAILADLLAELPMRPFMRRIRETRAMLRAIPGARLKRAFLGTLARGCNRAFDRAGLPGGDILAGIANHGDVHRPQFFERWLSRSHGQVVELMVHPGHRDDTLLGRDCVPGDGCLERRQREFEILGSSAFAAAVAKAGFEIVARNGAPFPAASELAHAA